MLRPSRALALALSFVILGGCVSAPVMLERPAGVPVAHHAAPSPLIAPRGMHTMALLDDAGSVQFVQNFGGGGVGVGLMLGPLGVAANAAAIRKTTERETALLKGRFTVDPQQRFAAVAAAQGFALAGTPDGARVSPYLAVIRADDERVLVGASLLVDHAPGGAGLALDLRLAERPRLGHRRCGRRSRRCPAGGAGTGPRYRAHGHARPVPR